MEDKKYIFKKGVFFLMSININVNHMKSVHLVHLAVGNFYFIDLGLGSLLLQSCMLLDQLHTLFATTQSCCCSRKAAIDNSDSMSMAVFQ